MERKILNSIQKILGLLKGIGTAVGFTGTGSGLMSLNPALAGGIIVGGALMARSARKKDRRLRGQLADQQSAF